MQTWRDLRSSNLHEHFLKQSRSCSNLLMGRIIHGRPGRLRKQRQGETTQSEKKGTVKQMRNISQTQKKRENNTQGEKGNCKKQKNSNTTKQGEQHAGRKRELYKQTYLILCFSLGFRFWQQSENGAVPAKINYLI